LLGSLFQSRKEGLYFKGDVVDFVVTSNEIGGLRVIAGSADKNIRIWDVENFEHVRLVQSFSISKPVKKISCIGSKIVTLCGGEESKADVLMNLFGSIQVWDLQV
jgi:WD40 repeat protein